MDLSVCKILLQLCSSKTLIQFIDDLTIETVGFNFIDVFLYFNVLFFMY